MIDLEAIMQETEALFRAALAEAGDAGDIFTTETIEEIQ